MTHKEYNLTEKEFYRFLEQLKAGNIKDIELEIDTEFLYKEVRYHIGDKEAVLLCDALKKNPHIRKVTLHNQYISDIGAKALAEVDSIEELMLPFNKVGPEGAMALAKSNLKVLNLYINPLVEYPDDSEYPDDFTNYEHKYHDDEEIAKMINAFINNKTITNLDLSNTGISGEFTAQLISNNTTIISLSAENNFTYDEALQYIGNNKTIRDLFISSNGISDVGAKYLVENTTLKTLMLHGNKITDAGAKILSTHSSLKTLFLTNNKITIEGMRYFLDSKLDTIEFSSQDNKIQRDICIFYDEFKQMLKSRAEVSQTIENETHDYDLAGDINNPDI